MSSLVFLYIEIMSYTSLKGRLVGICYKTHNSGIVCELNDIIRRQLRRVSGVYSSGLNICRLAERQY